ncbi:MULTISPECIES: hypothetical protein [unclassified Uliginosibacterium]|uniref:hypothetical protein n=1 Tax=unclassified Uliginosibacterium TaxID=2621521 RepID=UPI000C7CBBF4|nr:MULTISPECIES: hypothetical protein [unclassified Uliginosibacterium]MDO6385238.1 hypothetical protein [Uliginosibacterium sp. 31-12]PLK47727.1 hypothetical protein C0V76_15245 [Uliginosibacterium sp. TH139]
MIPAVSAFDSALFVGGNAQVPNIAPAAASATTNLSSGFGQLADALILTSLLNQDKEDNSDRMVLGELIMFGEALTAASKISQQLDSLFAGISQLSGVSAIQSA